MEAPVQKIQYEYITPTNIESEVPGTQDIREADAEIDARNSTVSLEDRVENPKDYVLSPVITVTKQESEFTKGDMKLQKVSVTENISDDIGAVYYTTNSNPNIQSEVISSQPVRIIDDDRKTRIPTLRKQERRGSTDKNEVPPSRLMQKRSSIPRLKDSRISPPLDRRSSKTDIKVETPLEDAFEKIYDEIVTEPKEIVTDVIECIKVEDPEKLENKFEEIIHDYEENKVHPITEDIPILPVNIGKPRSRIPLSKRKSEQEIKIPKPVERTTIKKDEPKVEKIESRIPMHKDLPHKAIRTKYNIRNDDKPIEVSKIAISKPKLKEKQQTEEIINKNPIEPVNIAPKEIIETTKESVVKEDKPISNNKTISSKELINTVKIEQEIIIQPVLQENVDVIDSIIKTNEVNEAKPREIEKDNRKTNGAESNTDYKEDEKENMDVEYRPGKVSRLLQRIRSQEFVTDSAPKTEISIPKKKSVLSKIAMFERHDSEDNQKPRPRVKPPIVKPKEIKSEILKEELVDSKPIIVDELLKEGNLDSLGYDNRVEYNPEEDVGNTKKDYAVEIQEDKVKFYEVETKTNIEDSNSNPVRNQIIDNSVDFTPKDEEIENVTNKSKFEPIASRNGIEFSKQNSKELLEPPPVNLDEKIPIEILDETLEKSPTKYNIEAPITKEEPSNGVGQNNLDTHNYEHNIDNKVDLPVENVTVHETQIETMEFQPIENSDEVFSGSKVEINKVFKDDEEIKEKTKVDEEIKNERPKSVAEMDVGDVLKGKVHKIIDRMNSFEKLDNNRKEIHPRERPRKKSVSKIIALFEQRSIQIEPPTTYRPDLSTKPPSPPETFTEEEYQEKINELKGGRLLYGRVENMTYMVLSNGVEMPVLAVGTALLDKRLVRPVVEAAIDMGYRAIDSAYIYGNEKEVGEAIQAKIDDGTVTRSDLFIISKLWSTFHRRDLVATACNASLKAMGLKYFDLYLIHNPVSFKEGADPIPKIANVVQYSSSDFLDAWYGMEGLVTRGLVKNIGLSNFNSLQVQRVVEKAKIKPVINQVECHPYLTQRQLDKFCSDRDVKLSCFGTLGSKGTPKEFTSGLEAAIDDPLVKVMAAGLNITAAQLLIRYQIDSGHNVVVKASSAAHLWENLQALTVTLDPSQVAALEALNRNKRIFTFVGIGDTHRNYPFRIPY